MEHQAFLAKTAGILSSEPGIIVMEWTRLISISGVVEEVWEKVAVSLKSQ